MLIPRTDTATLNGSGTTLATGLLIYQTSDNKFYYYNGSIWIGIDGPNTDGQTIDQFGFSGNTLSLSIENDGQTPQTVDLSSLAEDNQTVDQFALSGTDLNLSLEDDGQSALSVDLSSLAVDDQKIDQFNFSGNTLSLSLEDDGEANKTVDLSSLAVDDQKIDQFSLSGNTLSLSLEDDGESAKTVNLSSINTDNQQIDDFSLSGSTLSLAIEDDGQSTQTVDLSDFLPVGTIIMYPSSSIPTNWLVCDGSSFSASTYPDLNSVLGGNTLPDFSGRVPLGVGNSGENGSTNHNLLTDGGEETHTLTTSEMPSHNHGSGTLKVEEPVLGDSGSGTQDARDGSDKKLYEYFNITGSTANTGGGSDHNNMPPYLTINFIIKAK